MSIPVGTVCPPSGCVRCAGNSDPKVPMPSTPRVHDTGNRLLDRLPEDEFQGFASSLQIIKLELRDVISQFEAEVTHVHFPVTAMASLLAVLEDDDPVEVGTVGSEGMVGLMIALGVDQSPHRVICQMAGEMLRLPVQQFRDALVASPSLSRLMHRYAAFSLREEGQTIACNALHTIEARACRWLLMINDQARRDEFPMTQEFLAYMLGVRRQTVTVVAGTLQGAGLIRVRRGMIAILDREGLEDATCECYATTRDWYRRVVG